MQTFLPYPDFALSAAVLDRQRLGKQRVENLQIMKALIVPGAGWANHPAAKMWRDHTFYLGEYHLAIVTEWIGRGYKDTCAEKMADLMEEYGGGRDKSNGPPPWLGDKKFHRAHKSNLVRKDADHYRQFFPNVPDDLEYIWPTNP